MLLIYGECRKNATLALTVYRNRYPGRRHPNKNYFRRLEQYFRTEPRRQLDEEANEEAEVLTLSFVELHPTCSLRQIEMEMGIPRESARRILKRNGFRSYKYNIPQHLYETDFERRLLFCLWFQEQNNLEQDLTNIILFTDESRFTKNGMFNRQNSRYWSRQNLHLLRQGRFQEIFGINVWMGVVGHHIIGPIFFEGNLTGQRYLDFLQHEIENLINNLPNYQNLYFQQDGAPPHNARITTQYLNYRFPNRWIGTNGPVRWPARSPDLTPMDFFIWPFLKEKVYGQGPPLNLNQLRNRIEIAVNLITPVILENVKREFNRRIEMCVRENGGHVEHLL